MTIKEKRIGPDVGVIPFEERPVFGMENENRRWTWDVRGRRKTHSSSSVVDSILVALRARERVIEVSNRGVGIYDVVSYRCWS